MPYYNRDPKRDHNFDNHPCTFAHFCGTSLFASGFQGRHWPPSVVNPRALRLESMLAHTHTHTRSQIFSQHLVTIVRESLTCGKLISYSPDDVQLPLEITQMFCKMSVWPRRPDPLVSSQCSFCVPSSCPFDFPLWGGSSSIPKSDVCLCIVPKKLCSKVPKPQPVQPSPSDAKTVCLFGV